ncbi:Putative GPI mannosyltransferase [Septoria linicola]|uniref:Mannosyltransferase n=1 Tax=Septoria linicola TaxID=215465 RepID=A0A9Q9B7S9_9PEZI|nr:putative GPI mannosyltransferase [Septoria linicola]USW58641.1 Putative GPI mannosyltransferase [Septoria linicola]
MATAKNQGLHTIQAEVSIFIALLIFRTINSQLVQTFFQPDEYFQALEPAWQIAFGPDSGAWMTWEWREGLRTSVHPYLFAAAYKAVARICELVQANEHFRAAALGAAPRLLQAFWAAAMDLLTWRMAHKLYGSGHAASSAALALTVLSPWQWFCSVRPFSNSLEATLTALSLSSFPWSRFLEPNVRQEKGHKAVPRHSKSSSDLYLALTAAAAAFYLRPTNIIIWLSISVCLVWYNRSVTKSIVLIQAAAVVGITVTVAFACIDRVYYDAWTFPPLRFLYFNVVQSLAVFYGRNRPDYYVTEGLPLLLTTALPFALTGLYQSFWDARSRHLNGDGIRQRTAAVFAATALMTILALSTIAHKEMRFAYPLLPMLHVLAARPLASIFARKSRTRTALLAAGIAVNLYIAYYVSFVHQRGVVDVVHYLRHRQESWFDASHTEDLSSRKAQNITVGFLMPCHSTPWRSHLVYPEINAWALTCEPPITLPLDQRHTYLDEADVFYEDPGKWLSENMQDRRTIAKGVDEAVVKTSPHDDTLRHWPHYLVAFEQLQPTLAQILQGSRYRECKRFFNTHWHDDNRRHGDVVVWCMRR